LKAGDNLGEEKEVTDLLMERKGKCHAGERKGADFDLAEGKKREGEGKGQQLQMEEV